MYHQYQSQGNQPPENTWQRGSELITRGIPQFHPFCVKCNRPADYYVERYSPTPGNHDLVGDAVAGFVSVALTLFISLFTAFFFSFAVFFPPNNIELGFRVAMPLCWSHRMLQLLPRIAGVPLVLSGLVLIFMFIADLLYVFNSNERQYINHFQYWILFFFLVSIGTLLYKSGLQSVTMFEDRGYYYIRGVCRAYRNRFPSA